MTIIYDNKNITLKELKYGEVFYFYSSYETEKVLYMKVSNTIIGHNECGVVNLKTGYISREDDETNVVRVEAAIHVV